MAHKSTWPAVYPGLSTRPAGEIAELHSRVLRADVALIMSVAANNTILSHIVQHAIKSAADYARLHSLTYLDSDRFIDYLCKRTIGESPQETSPHDESGRGESVRVGAADVAAVAAVVGETAPSEQRRKASRGRKSGSAAAR